MYHWLQLLSTDGRTPGLSSEHHRPFTHLSSTHGECSLTLIWDIIYIYIYTHMVCICTYWYPSRQGDHFGHINFHHFGHTSSYDRWWSLRAKQSNHFDHKSEFRIQWWSLWSHISITLGIYIYVYIYRFVGRKIVTLTIHLHLIGHKLPGYASRTHV